MTATPSLAVTQHPAGLLDRQIPPLSDHHAEALSVPGTEAVTISPRRLRRAKKSYNARALARRVREDGAENYRLVRGSQVRPQPGDLVLARVETIGQHKRLESHTSRRRHLFTGDEVVVAYGHRYAPDQFLAEVPGDLDFTHLVAAGGLAGRVIAQHSGVSPATVLEPIGLIADDHGVLNMRRLAIARLRPWAQAREEIAALEPRPRIVLVLGSSMNSGKSTTLGCLVNGLTNAGLTVHAGKATGTGAGNDAGLFRDSGADQVLDFTDFGVASTYQLSLDEVKDMAFSVIAELAQGEPDAILVEVADGIYQGETAALIRDEDFRRMLDSVLFSCGEALSAVAGTDLLRRAGLPLAAVSGVLTSSPLITAEAAALLDVPIVPTFELCRPEVAHQLAGPMTRP